MMWTTKDAMIAPLGHSRLSVQSKFPKIRITSRITHHWKDSMDKTFRTYTPSSFSVDIYEDSNAQRYLVVIRPSRVDKWGELI